MKRGDRVVEFELPDQKGDVRSITSLLADGPLALFFYPAAMTPGCTKEACHFRDLAAEFEAAGGQRVGSSMGTVAKRKQFADKPALDYPLLSDPDGRAADIFGVRRGRFGSKLGAPVKRWTFAIGTDRKIVKAIHSELNMDLHADEALAALK